MIESEKKTIIDNLNIIQKSQPVIIYKYIILYLKYSKWPFYYIINRK